MITVITCSIDDNRLSAFKANIDRNIGVPYELIAVDNYHDAKGISEVYNKAVKQASYAFVCFIHEDVIIHSNGWGNAVIALLTQDDIGLLGVSGAVYKSSFPAAWSACPQSLYRMNTIQHFRGESQPMRINTAKPGSAFQEVAVLDGVFLAARKDVILKNKFDEQLKGFHGYDLDICLAVGEHLKIVVAYNILLEHFSEGNYSKDWYQSNYIVHSKWKQQLPKLVVPLATSICKEADYHACRSIVFHLLKFGENKLELLRYYVKLVTVFWPYNKFAFTKKVLLNLLNFKN